MIVFVVGLGIIILLSSKKNESYDSFLDKEATAAINSIFVILIFLSHSSQYLTLTGSLFDRLYLSFRRFLDQWVVVSFLMFSGYGVMTRIMLGGESYVKSFPRKRILKTLINFDIAVIMFLVLDLLLGIDYSVPDIAGSFIGLTSVGNSNWYIFAILVMYVFSYFAAIVFRDKYRLLIAFVVVLSLVYIKMSRMAGLPKRFASTAIAYPLGMFIALYKEKFYSLFSGYDKKSIISIVALLAGIALAYKYRSNIYVFNISSCFFALLILWFMAHFHIKSRFLSFIGRYTFSIYVLQRLPMIILFRYMKLDRLTNYLFVLISFAVTIGISYLYDKMIRKIDNAMALG